MFEDFHSFLYTGRIYSGDESETKSPGYDKEWWRLEHSWILGEVLLSGAFKDAVIDAIIHKIAVTKNWPITMYSAIYPHASDTSPIKKLMVDIVVHRWSKKDVSALKTQHNPALKAKFLQDVVVALFEVRASSKAEHTKSPITLNSGCTYHEHEADKPCYKTMFG